MHAPHRPSPHPYFAPVRPRSSRRTLSRVREGSAAAKVGAHERVEGAARALDRGFVKAQQDLADVAERTSNYVAGNPGRSLLIAAGIGFALGLFFRRNRDA